MPKKKPNTNRGRDELFTSEVLRERLKALKRFLEDNWARVGPRLSKAHYPEDVFPILKLVPNVEWCPPFRDHAAACLLREGTVPVEWRELRRTRQQKTDAQDALDRLWPEVHSANQKAQEASTALRTVVSQFAEGIGHFPFFLVAFLARNELGVAELTNSCSRLSALLQEAQKSKDELESQLSSQEAWFARNELVEFVNSDRFEKTPLNFAKAIAGLPEYGWLHSHRRCSALVDKALVASTTFNFQLLELLQKVVRKTRPARLDKIIVAFQNELLKPDTDPMLRSFVSPSWAYMEQACADCRNQHCSRADVPYKIMARFLDITEGPKSIAVIELAKRRQLMVP